MLDVTPLVLTWDNGEALAPKTVEISLSPDLPFKKLEVGDAGPNFQAVLKEIKPATHYELVVTPVPAKAATSASSSGNVTQPPTTGIVTRAQITLTLHLAGDQMRTSNVFAFVLSGASPTVKGN